MSRMTQIDVYLIASHNTLKRLCVREWDFLFFPSHLDAIWTHFTLETPSRKPQGSQIPHPDPTLRTTVNKDYGGQLFQCTTIRLYLKMCVFRDVKDYRSLSSGVELTTVLQIVTDSVKCLHTDSELSAQMGVNNFIFFAATCFGYIVFLSYMVILKCTLRVPFLACKSTSTYKLD